jgi:hypothetical protein
MISFPLKRSHSEIQYSGPLSKTPIQLKKCPKFQISNFKIKKILTLFFKKSYLILSADYTYKFLVNGQIAYRCLKFHLDTVNLDFSDY